MKIKFIFFTVVLLLSIVACKKNYEIRKPVLVKNDALIIGNPFDYGIDNLVIFPVGTNYKPVVYEASKEEDETDSYENGITKTTVCFASVNSVSGGYDRYAENEFVNSDEDKSDIRNILFYDLKTGETYPLVDETIHILSFSLHKDYKKPLIFYRVVKNDINNDSIFNSKDPVMLYISDIYGKGFKQITPANEQYIDYTYYSKNNIILIKSIIDSDNDKSFTSFDETNFREMKIEDPSMGREIFKSSLKDSLRIQLKTN